MAKQSITAKTIGEILKGNHVVSQPSLEIADLIIDSRKAYAPERCLFIALEGDYRDGHGFVEEMYSRGVRNFLVSKPLELNSDANIFVVKDTLIALQDLAKYKRNLFDIPVVGVTGSNGKTIVKEWVFQLLNGHFNIVRSPKSFNSQIGVPLSVWGMSEVNNFAVFEAGISLKNEMQKLEKIIQPNIGILTNIGQAHQENFESIKDKVLEKIALFKHSDHIIYNCDSTEVHEIMSAHFPEAILLNWGKSNSAFLQIRSVSKMAASAKIKGKVQGRDVKITIPFYDNASIENAIHCWALLLHLQLPDEEIQSRFEVLEPIAMRLEQKDGIDGSVVINDSYNSDVTALEIALDYMRHLNKRKRTVILSDMHQTGRSPKELYLEVSASLQKQQIHRFIGIGKDIFQHQELFGFRSAYFFQSTQQFLDVFHSFDFSNQCILVKGARKFKFERITSKLVLQSHQTQLKIHLDALRHNLNVYRAKLGKDVKTMVMVKAYGYGAGGSEVARVLNNNGVDYLGVAYADEGVAIRKAGINMPIMVMNPSKEAFSMIINYELEPEIYSIDVFEEYNKALETEGVFSDNYKIHIKIDTGMNRLGFRPEDIDALLYRLRRNKHIKVASIFSHLAASDDVTHDQFTNEQIHKFRDVASKIEGELGYEVIKHLSNTGGIERFPSAQFDMVRLGVGLYGVAISPKNQKKLRNVTSLHSLVVQLKKVYKGESVGYSRNFIANFDMEIAIVPVGYADGLDRRLGNGLGEVYVSGERRPIIGNVCMDLIMVDVTGLGTQVNEGVELFGPHISVGEIASKLNTISYEVLAGIPPRVKRIYIKEDS